LICALVLGACLCGCGSSATSVAQFCANRRPAQAGYWSGYGSHAGFVRDIVSAAKWPGQYDTVAGGLCELMRLQRSDGRVYVEGASSPGAARREVLLAIRRVKELPGH
jgi:hypothetical protein